MILTICLWQCLNICIPLCLLLLCERRCVYVCVCVCAWYRCYRYEILECECGYAWVSVCVYGSMCCKGICGHEIVLYTLVSDEWEWDNFPLGTLFCDLDRGFLFAPLVKTSVWASWSAEEVYASPPRTHDGHTYLCWPTCEWICIFSNMSRDALEWHWVRCASSTSPPMKATARQDFRHGAFHPTEASCLKSRF